MRLRAGNMRGFTLVELMVVLVLISIFSALVVAEMRGSYEDELLRSSARRLIDALNTAGSQAVTLNRAQVVLIDTKTGRFTVRSGARVGEAEKDSPALSEAIDSGEIDSRISIEVRDSIHEPPEESEERDPNETAQEKSGKLTFFPDGTATASEIVLRDRSGVELQLRLNAITGRVRIVHAEEEARP